MRAQGSLRVILNTKVWAGQTVERAAQKSVRISAWDIDENTVKIFLIQVRPPLALLDSTVVITCFVAGGCEGR